MSPILLMGEPIFRGVEFGKMIMAPYSQIRLCRTIIARYRSVDEVINSLRAEYLAIAHALKNDMGVQFWGICSHMLELDGPVVNAMASAGFRFIQFPAEYAPPFTLFPRDAAVNLPGITLVNPEFAMPQRSEHEGVRIVASPYGQAGRILDQGRVILVADKICHGTHSSKPDIRLLVEAGLKVGVLPTHLVSMGYDDPEKDELSSNDHLDRVKGFLRDSHGGLHLILDPHFVAGPASALYSEEQSVEMVRRVCDKMEIEVHVPSEMRVPYSVGMFQLEDGRVLMTSGDDAVAEVAAGIVGSENLFQTAVPIECYPAWMQGGIHCILNYAPVWMRAGKLT